LTTESEEEEEEGGGGGEIVEVAAPECVVKVRRHIS
jgi:hypothetical protein